MTEYAQRQAVIAWKWVGQGQSYKDQYATLARKLPSFLQVSGLGQTMAFLYSKSEDKATNAYGLLFRQLGNYLRDVRDHSDPSESKEESNLDRLMEVIVGANRDDYRRLTQEAMVIAEWVKRIATGRLGQGSED